MYEKHVKKELPKDIHRAKTDVLMMIEIAQAQGIQPSDWYDLVVKFDKFNFFREN